MKNNHIEGIIRITEKGFGFVDEVMIPEKYIGGAMEGDKVDVLITEYKNSAFKGSVTRGKVVGIIEEANPVLVGTVHFTGGQFILVPDNENIKFPVLLNNVPEELRDGDKAAVKLISRQSKFKGAYGEITDVLGGSKDPGVDITSIVAALVIPRNFSDEVLREIEDIPTELSEEEIISELKNGRRDIRGLSMVTIDSEDTKDVDDAVSVSRDANGNYSLGIHIADVTHYVKEGSALDREALERGNSVYLPDRVIPMLPKKLSNGICSLNEGCDRFAFSVSLKIDRDGNITDSEIFTSVINVKYKITYKQIYDLFENKNPDLIKKYASHLSELEIMKELAEKFAAKRHEKGSIDFSIPETKVILDDEGKPVTVEPAIQTFANNIIEEFMIAANETVATQFSYMGVPFLYRVHRNPDPERIEALNDLIKGMGLSVKGREEPHAREIANLLLRVKGSPREKVISTLALRAMQKAEYSAADEGHYALGLSHYSHFTSPIRRYPDLQIHRIMKTVLAGKMSNGEDSRYRGFLSDVAEQCSMTERRAETCERRCVALKVAEYMEKFIGYSFPGIISGVASFGIFVELPNSVEGMVEFNSLHDYYEFDRRNLCAVNTRTGHMYKIGDAVKIKVSGIDRKLSRVLFSIDGQRAKSVKYRRLKKKKIHRTKRR